MAKLLTNRADVDGIYNTIPVDNYTELSVELSALGITKTADKKFWVDGELEYTIVITNLDEKDPDDPIAPGLPVTQVVLVDKIDLNIARYIDDSFVLKIDGTIIPDPDFEYDETTGIITLTIPTLAARQIATATFRVEMP